MKTDKLVGLLGLCRRSGNLAVGFDAVVALCREKDVVLLLAEDAAERTARQLRFSAGAHPVYRIPLTREETARAVGSARPVAVLGTANPGFVRALRPLFAQEEESQYVDEISRQ